MVSLNKIRDDLKEVRYYYARKDLFDETFQSISTNVILELDYTPEYIQMLHKKLLLFLQTKICG
ncbi:MAG: hypothetical protein IJX96_00295 [Clostridia bacterium]|nr:hypothetical protein [Clostridia bacterium]